MTIVSFLNGKIGSVTVRIVDFHVESIFPLLPIHSHSDIDSELIQGAVHVILKESAPGGVVIHIDLRLPD